MNNNQITRTTLAGLFALAITMIGATVAMAGNDYQLKLQKSDGRVVRTVPVASDGSFSIGDLPAGSYTVTVVDAGGQTLDATGNLDFIVSPRDHASGLPTGKRQHKPVVFRQQATIVIEAGGGQITGTASLIHKTKSNIKND